MNNCNATSCSRSSHSGQWLCIEDATLPSCKGGSAVSRGKKNQWPLDRSTPQSRRLTSGSETDSSSSWSERNLRYLPGSSNKKRPTSHWQWLLTIQSKRLKHLYLKCSLKEAQLHREWARCPSTRLHWNKRSSLPLSCLEVKSDSGPCSQW